MDHWEATDPLGLPSGAKGSAEEAIGVRLSGVMVWLGWWDRALISNMIHTHNNNNQNGGASLPATVSTLRRVALFLAGHQRCVVCKNA